MIIQSRRGFIAGLTSLIAAPAVVKASSIMPVKLIDWSVSQPIKTNRLLTMREIMREAVRLYENSNIFIERVDSQYPKLYVNDENYY